MWLRLEHLREPRPRQSWTEGRRRGVATGDGTLALDVSGRTEQCPGQLRRGVDVWNPKPVQ